MPWGFGDLSWVTYERTYSRDGERWWQTCRRVIEGMFTILRVHCLAHRLPWDEGRAQAMAREAYERLFRFQWTPPGRGLWIMGTPFVYQRGGAALNNCGFVSTREIASDYAAPFTWMLRMSMLGVGVGFDTRGRGTVTVGAAREGDDVHLIEDSREGWSDALGRLLDAYAGHGTLPARFDYSAIRPAGSPVHGFGGTASGPAPLRKMLESLRALYDGYVGQAVDARLIVDTMNLIGRCVVAGGIRRSAQIAFGAPDDIQFLDLKQDGEKLTAYRWVSNNSVFAEIGMDYREAARRTAHNGEPGYLWLDNARAFGRMGDPPSHDDEGAEGSNPCVEQTLWDRELCCLVETYPANHDGFDDFARTLRLAYLYAKAVTLVRTGDPTTDAVMVRNRRIGCSMTGVVQAIHRHGYRRFFEWCDRGYARVRVPGRRVLHVAARAAFDQDHVGQAVGHREPARRRHAGGALRARAPLHPSRARARRPPAGRAVPRGGLRGRARPLLGQHHGDRLPPAGPECRQAQGGGAPLGEGGPGRPDAALLVRQPGELHRRLRPRAREGRATERSSRPTRTGSRRWSSCRREDTATRSRPTKPSTRRPTWR